MLAGRLVDGVPQLRYRVAVLDLSDVDGRQSTARPSFSKRACELLSWLDSWERPGDPNALRIRGGEEGNDE